MASPDPMLGCTLGHYRICEQIGAGGMGVVYRARDERLERDVALKVLPPGALADDSARRRFRKEALALSRLNHPNIATVHDFDTQAGIDFLVTELVPGVTLLEKLLAGPLPEKEVLHIGLQLAEGLEAAHGDAIIHRDLKPGNLRLTPAGRLKILDFGLAKRLDLAGHASLQTASLSGSGNTAGTLAYMSPEQLQGGEVDTRADLWAAGVVLYELSTARLPFEGKTWSALADAILHAIPPAPQSLRPQLSLRLAEVIEKCLEKDPGNRYQSATELRVDLRRLSLPATAGAAQRPWSDFHPLRDVVRFASQHRSVRWGIATVALVILVAILIAIPSRKAQNPTAGANVAVNTTARLSTGGAASPVAEANEYFEKAMLFLMAQYDLPRAREMLEQALARDPRFAEARAWYGFTDVQMVDSGFSNDGSWFYKAEQEARQALRDDPNCGRAHSTLAAAYLLQGRKELVPAEIEKALAANPADLDASIWLLNYQELIGNYAAAQSLALKLLAQNPLFFPARMNLGDALHEQGDIRNAIVQYRKILEVDAQNNFAVVKLARAHMDAGHLSTARATLARGRAADRENYDTRLAWALLQALEGKKQEAAREIDPELAKYCQVHVLATLSMAEFYAAMGDTPQALAWLERAVNKGDERVEWFRRDPALANIRNERRFQEILDSTAYRRQQRASVTAAPQTPAGK